MHAVVSGDDIDEGDGDVDQEDKAKRLNTDTN